MNNNIEKRYGKVQKSQHEGLVVVVFFGLKKVKTKNDMKRIRRL